ncbi:hypothetical protein BU26DRAFT_570905 [Trematosphaeria pertusa]|uniref:Uncharacterized protein n=1 Tax=Trematosphaeria pertusa TaxID=390896 RepID=A0A6A6HWC3_9PLEO|nr:uncharacterized protein BU26DRAFT_570905 [Trematosphaeria pertusa]KAF2242219.1 hypothetical protein BU26DRAFT_570905 [Trematosphaeria pertusa]
MSIFNPDTEIMENTRYTVHVVTTKGRNRQGHEVETMHKVTIPPPGPTYTPPSSRFQSPMSASSASDASESLSASTFPHESTIRSTTPPRSPVLTATTSPECISNSPPTSTSSFHSDTISNVRLLDKEELEVTKLEAEKCERARKEAQRQVQALSIERDELAKELARKNEAYMGVQIECRAIGTERDELKKGLAKKDEEYVVQIGNIQKTLETEHSNIVEELRTDLDIRVQQKESELAALRNVLRELRQLTTNNETSFKDRIEGLEAEKGRLEADLHFNHATHKEALLEAARENERLRDVIVEYRDNASSSSAMAMVMTKDLVEENMALSEDNEKLRKENSTHDIIIADLHDQLVKASQDMSQQIQLCNDARGNASNMKVEKTKMEEKLRMKSKRVVQLRNELEAANRMLGIGEAWEMATTLDNASSLMDEFKQLHAKNINELKDAHMEIHRLQTQFANRSEELQIQKALANDFENQFDNLFLEEHNARAQLPQLEDKISELELKLQHRDSEVDRLSSRKPPSFLCTELKEKETEIERLCSERRPLDDHIAQLQDQNNEWSTTYEKDIGDAKKTARGCYEEFNRMVDEYEGRITALHRELGRPYPPPDEPIDMENVDRHMVRVLRELYEDPAIPEDIFPGEGEFLGGYAYAPVWDAFGKKYPHLKELACIRRDVRLAVPCVKAFTLEDARRVLKGKMEDENLKEESQGSTGEVQSTSPVFAEADAEDMEEGTVDERDFAGLTTTEYDELPSWAKGKWHALRSVVE